MKALMRGALALILAAALPIPAAAFTEPPAVLYGKVFQVDTGSSYQVFSGELEITLTSDDVGANSVTLSTELVPSGVGGVFSYRLDVPQKYLPGQTQLDDYLAVDADQSTFRFSSITVDGVSAVPLDSAQALLTTSFDKRAQEHRLDLRVSLSVEDSDGDGIPNWWEELYGLNPLFAGDADDDPDGDGIKNIDEFRNGTDPNVGNADPTVIANTVSAPEGGSAGLMLTIADADTADGDLNLRITSAVAGLTFRDSGGTLTPPATFTYEDVRNGEIVIEVAFGTAASTVPMSLTDTTGANTAVPFNLSVVPFSPANQLGPQPAVWLEPTPLSGNLAEWPDQTANNRDGYQPTAGDRPAGSANGAVFDGGNEFLYFDDRNLALAEFSAFFAFNADQLKSEDQVLFHAGGLDFRIGGSGHPLHASTLLARRDGQVIEGPPVPFASSVQTTISGAVNESFLAVGGGALFGFANTTETLPTSFPLIGAKQTISESSASQFFDGTFHEVLVYDTPLDAAQRARIEDYQLSRWNGLVIWDTRSTTTPQIVNGHPGVRNAISGGWGEDALGGAELDDILRGGPGNDRLTGNAGADRFQIFSGHGDETLTDFSESDGDILDLTAIFAGVSGIPDDFLTFRTEIVRPASGTPKINSVLEIDYDGGLDDVDQSVTFEGVALSAADLPRLVGGGTFQLCGPMYPTAVTIAASEEALTETVSPRQITLSRSGNLAAPLSLDLSFVGSAMADEDYGLAGVTGSGAIRSTSFAVGESEKVIDLTPVQDTLEESETIEVAILPSPRVTSGPLSPLGLTLNDAPSIEVEVLRRYAERLGSVPGIVYFHRTGDLSAPLDVTLQFTGSAENGRDYLPISPNLTFPAGVATVEVEVTPSEISPVYDRVVVAQLGIVSDPSKFALSAPWSGSVMIVDGIEAIESRTFGDFRKDNFPANLVISDVALGEIDHDFDGLNTLGEYVNGTDPNTFNRVAELRIEGFNSGGFFEYHVTTASGLTDVSIDLQVSPNMSNWFSVGDDFELSYHWLSDGRIRRIYRSRISVNNLANFSFYRVLARQLTPTDLEATEASAFGSANESLLAKTGPVWVPSSDGNQLEAPALEVSETSGFSTFLDGAFTAEFEWRADAGHQLSVTLDGVEMASATGTSDWVKVGLTTASMGLHELVWTITRNASATSDAEPEALRNLVITQP